MLPSQSENLSRCSTKLTQRAHHVDITLIRWRPNFYKFPRHFHVLLRYNFGDWKIHVVPLTFSDAISMVEKSTLFSFTFLGIISLVENFVGGFHVLFFDVISMIEISMFFQCIFFRCNFNGRNLHIVSTYFFWCNFSFHNILVVSFYFFWQNFNGWKLGVVCTYYFRRNMMGKNSMSFLGTFFDVISLVRSPPCFQLLILM